MLYDNNRIQERSGRTLFGRISNNIPENDVGVCRNIVIIMSKFTYPSYTREQMKDMHKIDIERWKKMKEVARESKIIGEVNVFQGYVINLNTEGYTNYTRSFFCRDPTFVSEIADKLRERFPDSKVVVDDSTIGSMILLCLFNYRSITIMWK